MLVVLTSYNTITRNVAGIYIWFSRSRGTDRFARLAVITVGLLLSLSLWRLLSSLFGFTTYFTTRQPLEHVHVLLCFISRPPELA